MKRLKQWLYGLKTDKLLHFIAGMLIAEVAAVLLGLAMGGIMAAFCGWLLSVVVSMAKEIWDKGHDGVCSMADFAAGLFGALVGLAVMLLVVLL